MKNCFILLLFISFSTLANKPNQTITIKASQLPTNKLPKVFDDDLNFKNMLLAISRQKKAFERSPLKGRLIISKYNYPLSKIKKSLLEFEKIVLQYQKCDFEHFLDCKDYFANQLKEKFNFFVPQSTNPLKKNAFLTGYYSPTINSSLKRTKKYRFGVYKKPKSNSLRTLTREKIIFRDKLENKSLNLFYTDDLFELYLLHVEGGGRVYLNIDGKVEMKYLSYAGHNSQKFTFISKYMKKMGYIDDGKIKSQRKFLRNNPKLWREIYSICKGYIYFKYDKFEPVGLEDIPLTENRSLAQDRSIYKRKGLLAFVESEIAVEERGDVIVKKHFSRFFIDQDTGSAIVGGARADLYFGFGKKAAFISENMENTGRIIFLILK